MYPWGLLITLATQTSGLPAALERAIQVRESIDTARIEYSVEWLPGGATEFFTWQAAGPDYAQTSRGDEDGVFRRDTDGRPLEPYLDQPELLLAQHGQVWRRSDESTDVYLEDAPAVKQFTLRDLRYVGLSPSLGIEDPRRLDEALAEFKLGPASFSSRQEDGLEVVEATWNGGAVVWHIDPGKNWSVVRCESLQNGMKIGETRISLAFDDEDQIWFPSEVQSVAANGQSQAITRIHHVEVNRPEHPPELTPASIGVEPGMLIMCRPRIAAPAVWDGDAIVSQEEFATRLGAGQVHFGPAVVRDYARSVAYARRHPVPGPATADGEQAGSATGANTVLTVVGTEWERYTREFIEHFALDHEQTDKAWTVCRLAQESAKPMVTRIGRAQRRATTQPQAHTPDLRRMLLTELDKHFAAQLQARLEKLPTRAQRSAATGDPPKPPSAAAQLP